MRKLILRLSLLVVMVIAAVVVFMPAAPKVSSRPLVSSREKSTCNTALLKTLKTECSTCCNSVQAEYTRCRFNRKGMCDCIQEAWDQCSFNCAPCTCCSTWLTAWETQKCGG